MKIVNREEFLRLPSGTIYTTYEPCIFGNLSIKYDCTFSGEDFYFLEIAGSIESSSSDEFFDRVEAMANNGEAFPIDLDVSMRDGCFEKDQLYAVWEKEDVQSLITVLQKSLLNFN